MFFFYQSLDEEFGCSDCPASNWTNRYVEKVHEIIHEDRQPRINDICNILGMLYGACQHILTTDINVKWIAAVLVPCLQNDDHKHNRLFACQGLQDRAKKDRNFLLKVITGDEAGFMVMTQK
jgi:hypothetical protein